MREHLRRSSVVSAVAGLLVAILAFVPAILPFLHWERPKWYEVVGGVIALLALWISFVLAMFFQQLEIEREIRSLQQYTRSHDVATTEIIAGSLSSAGMEACRSIFSVCNKILETKNPLMDALACSQIDGLAEFLGRFENGLPFLPESELITIDKHYTSFMQRMGKDGKYYATTFVQFWHQQGEEILGNFFQNNEIVANDGVRIRRVFLIAAKDEDDPQTFAVLRRHSSMTRKYRNGGAIETKVLLGEFNLNLNDFGIYALSDQLMAIATASFDATGRLRGNEVRFEKDYMRKMFQLFEARWHEGITIAKYLEDHDRSAEGAEEQQHRPYA